MATFINNPQCPIGILDSGIGGLSILKEIQRQLPNEQLLYLADSAYAPYGERSVDQVQARTLALCHWLVKQNCKALVIACNTATAHAIQLLRHTYTQQLIIGVEPGIKPAQALTRTGVIGVLATHNTLMSEKFHSLITKLQTQYPTTRFICQAGTGLVPLIERGQVDSATTEALLRKYLTPMLAQHIDTLVLGCTHYPFLSLTIQRIVGPNVQLIDTSCAVAKHLSRELQRHALLNQTNNDFNQSNHLYATAKPERLSLMAKHLLNQELIAQLIFI